MYFVVPVVLHVLCSTTWYFVVLHVHGVLWHYFFCSDTKKWSHICGFKCVTIQMITNLTNHICYNKFVCNCMRNYILYSYCYSKCNIQYIYLQICMELWYYYFFLQFFLQICDTNNFLQLFVTQFFLYVHFVIQICTTLLVLTVVYGYQVLCSVGYCYKYKYR